MYIFTKLACRDGIESSSRRGCAETFSWAEVETTNVQADRRRVRVRSEEGRNRKKKHFGKNPLDAHTSCTFNPANHPAHNPVLKAQHHSDSFLCGETFLTPPPPPFSYLHPTTLFALSPPSPRNRAYVTRACNSPKSPAVSSRLGNTEAPTKTPTSSSQHI